jgi:hypothetical protein
MRSRGFGFVATGRLLVVERYRESCLSPSASQLPGPGPAGAGGLAERSDSRGGSGASARPRQAG